MFSYRCCVLLILFACGAHGRSRAANATIQYVFDEGSGTRVYDHGISDKVGGLWHNTIGTAQWLSSLSGGSFEPQGIQTCDACGTAGSPRVFDPNLPSIYVFVQSNLTSYPGAFAGPTFCGFTVEVWFRPDDLSVDRNIVDVTNYLAYAPGGGPVECSVFPDPRAFNLMQKTGGLLEFSVTDRPRVCHSCDQDTLVTPALVVGQLYHVVAVVPSTPYANMRLFINGVEQPCSSQLPYGQLDQSWYYDFPNRVLAIGSQADGNLPWAGKLYYFALYSRNLSDGEIAQNYAFGPYNPRPTTADVSGITEQLTPIILFLNGTSNSGDALHPYIMSWPVNGNLYQVTAGGGLGAQITGSLPALVTDSLMRVAFFPVGYTYGNTSFLFNVKDDNTFALANATASIYVRYVPHATAVQATVPSATVEYGQSVALPITVTNVDSNLISVYLQARYGLLTLTTTTGLTFYAGQLLGTSTVATATKRSAMYFTTSQANLAPALASLRYESFYSIRPTRTLPGIDRVMVNVSDEYGWGGTVAIVTPTLNKMSVSSIPASYALVTNSTNIVLTLTRAPQCTTVLTVQPYVSSSTGGGAVTIHPSAFNIYPGQTTGTFVVEGVSLGFVTIDFTAAGTAAAQYDLSGNAFTKEVVLGGFSVSSSLTPTVSVSPAASPDPAPTSPSNLGAIIGGAVGGLLLLLLLLLLLCWFLRRRRRRKREEANKFADAEEEELAPKPIGKGKKPAKAMDGLEEVDLFEGVFEEDEFGNLRETEDGDGEEEEGETIPATATMGATEAGQTGVYEVYEVEDAGETVGATEFATEAAEEVEEVEEVDEE